MIRFTSTYGTWKEVLDMKTPEDEAPQADEASEEELNELTEDLIDDDDEA